jgi:hypothetical protein
MAYYGRAPVPAPGLHYRLKVHHVTSDRQRLAAAAALKRLDYPEGIGEFASYGSQVSRSGRPSVQEHCVWSGASVFAGLQLQVIRLTFHRLKPGK